MTWHIYLLYDGSRTYVGSTTDPHRRLRQHNGEIRGGARATRSRSWHIVAYVSGFPDRSSACRWEKLVKMRARGQPARLQAMMNVAAGICPSPGKHYDPPSGLEFVHG